MEHKIIIDVTIITPTIEEIVRNIKNLNIFDNLNETMVKRILYAMVIIEKLNQYRAEYYYLSYYIPNFDYEVYVFCLDNYRGLIHGMSFNLPNLWDTVRHLREHSLVSVELVHNNVIIASLYET